MYEPFFLIGLILVAGFTANWIFSRIRVSQVLILIALGFLLGPVFKIVDSSTESVLFGLAPFVGALALIILLFDGGITLNVFELLKVLPKATVFTLLVFAASVAAVAFLATMLFGWGLLESILLGATLGGTSSAIVLAMIERANSSQETKNVLALESGITDALCIVTAVIVLQLIKSNVPVDASNVLNLLAAAFSIALLAGALAGVGWILALKKLSKKQFPYMLTLSVVFLLYGLVEAAKGNGGIAVFSFGLVLGNAKRITEFLKITGDYELDKEITDFQEEVTFFTRTFFFVFLGLIINLSGITPMIAVLAVIATALFLLIRWVSQKIVLNSSNDSKIITSMLPRGLAAAVLAGLPAAEGIVLPGFTEIALLIIILTNVIATIGIYKYGSPSIGTGILLPKILEIKNPPEQKTEKFVR